MYHMHMFVCMSAQFSSNWIKKKLMEKLIKLAISPNIHTTIKHRKQCLPDKFMKWSKFNVKFYKHRQIMNDLGDAFDEND